MSEPSDRTDPRPTPERAPSIDDDDRITLLATVQQFDGRPDECTIYPAAVDPDRRTTTWITATEGAFCSLDDCR